MKHIGSRSKVPTCNQLQRVHYCIFTESRSLTNLIGPKHNSRVTLHLAQEKDSGHHENVNLSVTIKTINDDARDMFSHSMNTRLQKGTGVQLWTIMR